VGLVFVAFVIAFPTIAIIWRKLAKSACTYGEFPFASLLRNGNGVVSEAINQDTTQGRSGIPRAEKLPATRISPKCCRGATTAKVAEELSDGR
jgi:hypothetical protein